MMEIYADYAAAAPVRPKVCDVMLEALAAGLGNPSSIHDAGARARARLEAAREEVAAALGAHPLEIVFTSGATEANNLALWGAAEARREPGHLAVPATEHSSILAPARALVSRGHRLTELPTDSHGRTDPQTVSDARPDMLSVALVNAETGVMQDVRALAGAARSRGTLVHVDAAQGAHFATLAVDTLGVDLLTISSTKLGGPPGAGALYVRRGTPLAALHLGGSQEQGLRAGTENVPAIVGFALALALARAERAQEELHLTNLRDALRREIAAAWPGARFAPWDRCLTAPHIVNVTLPGVVGEDVVAALDLEGIAASTGSACAAGAAQPSHVLRAMGWNECDARSALRLSLGWGSSSADVDGIVRALVRVLARITKRSEEAAWPVHAS